MGDDSTCAELWSRRELLWFLAWRDIRVRYKQTFLGVGWAILQPFLQMVVFSVVFGVFTGVPTDTVTVQGLKVDPISGVFHGRARSLGLVRRDPGRNRRKPDRQLRYPHEGLRPALADSTGERRRPVGGFRRGVCHSHWDDPGVYGSAITPNILWIPVFLLLLIVCALGFGLWLSALNMYIRDIQMLVPFLVSLWEFASPVVYSPNAVPAAWRFVYALNPMAGVLIGFRWCLLGTAAPGPEIWASVVVAVVVFLSGVVVFQRVQRNMVDIL